MNTKMNWLRIAWRSGCPLALGILLAGAGCQVTRPGPAEAHPTVERVPATEDAGALLRPGLTVNVQVLVTGQKEIDEKNRRISEAGSITLPLVGEIRLAGLTVAEAQDQLRTSYDRVFVAPQVIVECQMEAGDSAVSPWGYVTVLGRVKKPGQVNVPPTRELTVSRAIQLAGGLDTSARSNAIRVTRTRGSAAEQFEVDLDRIGALGQTKDDVRLLPGDVVYVPEAVL